VFRGARQDTYHACTEAYFATASGRTESVGELARVEKIAASPFGGLSSHDGPKAFEVKVQSICNMVMS
jgi:hypothetical protein